MKYKYVIPMALALSLAATPSFASTVGSGQSDGNTVAREKATSDKKAAAEKARADKKAALDAAKADRVAKKAAENAARDAKREAAVKK